MTGMIMVDDDVAGQSWVNSAFVKRIRLDPTEGGKGYHVVLEMADGSERVSISSESSVIRPSRRSAGALNTTSTSRCWLLRCRMNGHA